MKMLGRADGMAVLEIRGWRESVGVRQELRTAQNWGFRVIRVFPTNRDDGTIYEVIAP